MIICPKCNALSVYDATLYDLDDADHCEDGRFGPKTCAVEITCVACKTVLYRKEGEQFQ